MPSAILNVEHIEAIDAAMNFAHGDFKTASQELINIGWEGWTPDKLFNAVRNNKPLRERWGLKKESGQKTVRAKDPVETSLHRPAAPAGLQLPESIQERSDQLAVVSLENQENEFRKQLKAMGEDKTAVDFMVAAGNLQSKFALCTLNAVTGGLVKAYNELRKAQQETMEDLHQLLGVSDPVEKASLVEREKLLRDFYIQLHQCQVGAFDRINKAFYLQLEARKLDRGANGRPKKMLGINAAAGSRVAVQLNVGNGKP